MKNKRVMAIVGGQYGSEGKGVVAKHYANEFDVHVRVGGPNAGHCFVHQGIEYKMQSVPCGWVNPEAALVVGRGAVVDLEQLRSEVDKILKVDTSILDRLKIDGGAMVIDNRHRNEEGGTKGEMHNRIGSTGKGVGAARVAFIKRDESLIKKVRDVAAEYGLEKCVMEDTSEFLNDVNRKRGNILLEGTQGFGLSLVHGDHPYVTSADTTAGQILVDCGLAATKLTDCVLVVRSMPIRVAGNSGRMLEETDWKDLSKKIGKKVEERTTVTNKVRRIGHWDEQLVIRAARINGATSVAFTFLDYVVPEDEKQTNYHMLKDASHHYIDYVGKICGAPVKLVGTGYDLEHGWYCVDMRRTYEPESDNE